jgi:hypothetical protein
MVEPSVEAPLVTRKLVQAWLAICPNNMDAISRDATLNGLVFIGLCLWI